MSVINHSCVVTSPRGVSHCIVLYSCYTPTAKSKCSLLPVMVLI